MKSASKLERQFQRIKIEIKHRKVSASSLPKINSINKFQDPVSLISPLIYFNKMSPGVYYRKLYSIRKDIKFKIYKQSVQEIDSYIRNFESVYYHPRIILNNSKFNNSELFDYLKNEYGHEELEIVSHFFELREQFMTEFIEDLKYVIAGKIRVQNRYPAAAKKPAEKKPAVKHTIKPISTAFCWNKARNKYEDLVKLHTLLREYDYIDKDTSVSQLEEAFNCKAIFEPLQIKWIKKVKGKTAKTLIFHFIDEMERLRLIEVTMQNSILFTRLKNIFSDTEGKDFKNLAVSKSMWLNQRVSNRTPQEQELDLILLAIKG
ncbi:MAG: hypothetical protein WD607_07420 [Candidatus Paceibacterota bacterium]